MRFSYFPGCTDHSTSIEYGLSTHEVFKTLGVESGRDRGLELLRSGSNPQSQSSPLSLSSGQEYLEGPVAPGRASGRSLCRVFQLC